MHIDKKLVDTSLVHLVKEGCISILSPGGEELDAEAVQAIFDEYGEVPDDFGVRITEKGRDALARGRP